MDPGELRGWLATSSGFRAVYRRVREVPALRAVSGGLARVLFPRGKLVTRKIRSGLARGFLLQFDPRYHIDYVTGGREPEFQDLLAAHLKPGDTFVDVG